MLKKLMILIILIVLIPSSVEPVSSSGHLTFQLAKLIPSQGMTGSRHGYSVDIDGDTAIVGSEGIHAFVFINVGGVWMEQANLTEAGTGGYGFSVSIDGDTAVVGAPFEDCMFGTECGAAYVYVRSGNVWSYQAQLLPAIRENEDQFGRTVSLDGDTVIVGEIGDGANDGSVYVFVRNSGVWSEQQKLTPSGSTSYFGLDLALSGDTALIGADANPIAFQSGIAYVFVRNSGVWSEQATLIPNDGAQGDIFGWELDLDGDTAIVGAVNDSDNGSHSGSAYIFVRSGTSWGQQAKLLPGDGAADDAFGYGAAISGDLAVVGAIGDDDNGMNSGSAYVFSRSGSSWTQEKKLLASDGSVEDNFGRSAAVSVNTMIIGAFQADGIATGSGAAYVFGPAQPLMASASCNGPNLEVNISGGDPAFDVTGSAGPGLPLNGVNVGTHVLAGPGTWTDVTVTETAGDGENINLGDFTCEVPTDTPIPPTDTPTGPVALVVSASCNVANLEVTITAGDGPFNITASAGINTPVFGVELGMTVINGPEKWDNLTVTETSGNAQSINLGQFKCRTDERPVPLTPPHRTRTTNRSPVFSWTPVSYASRYRIFLFDNKVVADRTVDIRQNTSGPETYMIINQPLPLGRLFWRIRGRTNRVWGLWSVRYALFIDPPAVAPMTPVPTIDLGDGESAPQILPTPIIPPTFPPPPNSR